MNLTNPFQTIRQEDRRDVQLALAKKQGAEPQAGTGPDRELSETNGKQSKKTQG